MRPESSLKCIFQILEAGAWAVQPIKEKLPLINVPICFIYGDTDWISRSTADELKQKGRLKEGSEVHSVSNSGHNLHTHNPRETALKLAQFVFGKSESLDSLIKDKTVN